MKEFRNLLCRYVKLKFLFRAARCFVLHVKPPERSEFLYRGTHRRVSPLKRALWPTAFTSNPTDLSPRCAIIVHVDRVKRSTIYNTHSVVTLVLLDELSPACPSYLYNTSTVLIVRKTLNTT